jgi:heme/copper-type cytochrome/quinol oxidase subunit 2
VKPRLKQSAAVAALLIAVAQQSASACATCYGASSDPMAQGMNWGIMTLLVVITGVLIGVSAFFVHVARRSSALAAASALNQIQPETKQ